MICPYCKTVIANGLAHCNHCGTNLTASAPADDGTKACPFCAEKIKKEAVKCRYCGEFLGEARPAAAAVAAVAAPAVAAAPKLDGAKTHLQGLKISIAPAGKFAELESGKLQFEGTKVFLKKMIKRKDLFDLKDVTAMEHRGGKLVVHLGQIHYVIDLFKFGKDAIPYKATFARLAGVTLPEYKPDHKKTAIIIISIAVPCTVFLFSFLLFRFMTVVNALVLLLGVSMLFLAPLKSLFAKNADPTAAKKVFQYKVGVTGLAVICFAISVCCWIMDAAAEAAAEEAKETAVVDSKKLIADGDYKQALAKLANVEAEGELAQDRSKLLVSAREGLFAEYLDKAKNLAKDEDYKTASSLLGKINDRSWSRYDEVKQLAQEIADAIAALKKLEERKDFETSFPRIDRYVAEGRTSAAESEWLAADVSYASALAIVDFAHNARNTWLGEFVPEGFDAAARKREINSLRQKIAGKVAGVQRQADHQRRLNLIQEIKSSLDPSDRDTFLAARTSLNNELNDCGKCKTKGKLKKALSDVNAVLSRWPIELGSINEMQTRYADLRGRRVRVKGSLGTSTYYNCKFRSQNTYRSFTLSEGLFGIGGIHVYCYRGDDGCETIFQSLASGGSESGTAILEYPNRNSVCEESQAYLLGWR